MSKIGFIGMGHIGTAIMNSLIETHKKEDLLFTCAHPERGVKINEKTGVRFVSSNQLCAREADILILAVKPVVYDRVLEEIRPEIGGSKLVISLAPGITIAEVSEKLGGFKRIVRAMPNTPAQIREGMTGICYDDSRFTDGDREELAQLFLSFGRMKKLDERLMDAVTVISGSSPAFVFMFIDALSDAGFRYGMKKTDALEMAAQALLGSAKMVLETGEHPSLLKDAVCSPGGTTIEAVAALEETGFRNVVLKGAEACYRRCRGEI